MITIVAKSWDCIMPVATGDRRTDGGSYCRKEPPCKSLLDLFLRGWGLCLRLLDARGGAPVAGTLTVASRTPITRATSRSESSFPRPTSSTPRRLTGRKSSWKSAPIRYRLSSSGPAAHRSRLAAPLASHAPSRRTPLRDLESAIARLPEKQRSVILLAGPLHHLSPSFTQFN